jgi:hypothetical protein
MSCWVGNSCLSQPERPLQRELLRHAPPCLRRLASCERRVRTIARTSAANTREQCRIPIGWNRHGLGWCFPQPAEEPLASVSNRPNIRIASAELLPERIVIDTSLPTIVPPPSVLEFAQRWPEQAVADVDTVLTPTPVSEVPKKQNPAKREPPKRVAVHHAAPKVNIESASNDKAPASPAVTRLSSLLDTLKEGLGQTQAKLIASLEPLTSYVSKPRPEIRR